jgi:hypothetical protein
MLQAMKEASSALTSAAKGTKDMAAKLRREE